MKQFRVYYYTGGVEAMKPDRHGASDSFERCVRNAAGHVAASEVNKHEHRLAIIAKVSKRGQSTILRSYKLANGQITIKERT